MKNTGESVSSMNELSDEMLIRKAKEPDTDGIWDLLHKYSDQGLLLSLSKEDIQSRINTFAVGDINGTVVGCASLKNFGNNLFEIRSLAVNPDYTGKKIGTKLVEFLINESSVPSGSRLFALTYRVSFFKRLGFELVSKDLFPEKIWEDCEKCSKKNCCDENAVLKIIK